MKKVFEMKISVDGRWCPGRECVELSVPEGVGEDIVWDPINGFVCYPHNTNGDDVFRDEWKQIGEEALIDMAISIWKRRPKEDQ